MQLHQRARPIAKAGFAWPHFLALALLAAGTQLLYYYASRGALGYPLAYFGSTLLLFIALAVAAWAGFDAVEKAGAGTLYAIVLGAVLSALAALCGLLFSEALGLQAGFVRAVFSLAVAGLLGGIFAGLGGMLARIRSRFWLS